MTARVTEGQGTRRVVMGGLLLRITAVLVLFTVAVYIGIYARTRELVMRAVDEQASTYVDLIIKDRAWNSGYGGVWVEKVPGVESNPYLETLGIEPDRVTEDGTVLTLRNPALMTNEVAAMLERDSGVQFHLTSLRPVNPDNAPDTWEEDALRQFEDEEIDVVAELVDDSVGSQDYRYMVPLIVDDSCLSCHASQGYGTGEIRGGISVSIPFDETAADLRLNSIGLGAMALLTLFGIVGTVSLMSARVVERLDEADRQLEHLAVSDPLTDLWNRRYMLRRLKAEFDRSRRQGHDLGLVMLDLDNFKDVNDHYGHGFGDIVLQATTRRMHGAIRDYDVLGRFGGEEFLVIAPETDADGVVALAERVRTAVGRDPISGEAGEVTVTTSAGVAMLIEADLTPDALLARADAALYAAKRLGRDRVVLGESPESRGML